VSAQIRPATRGDANGITDVQVASWRAGYAHVFPESVLYADDFDATRRTFWTSWRFAPGHRVAVALDDEADESAVVGFASYGPERERARGFTGRGELWALYLHPDRWGSGIASELLTYTETRLQTEGFDSAVLWVLKDNLRGRAFYEKHGWEASGIAADYNDYSEISLAEIEYRKDLSYSPTP
jgi:ribosomal protein S18 acetylase RimI-like enzyme